MEPEQIEKFIGLTFLVLAVTMLLFMLQFVLSVAIPSIAMIAAFVLLFLLSLLTGFLVLIGTRSQ